MNRIAPTFALGCAILGFSVAAVAGLEGDAANAIHRGDFAAAVAAYEKLVEDNPTSVALRLELADALAKNRQWKRAVDEYQKVLRRQPGNVEAMLGIGTVHRWEGNIVEAKRSYEQVLALSPQEPNGMQGLAA